MTTNTQMADFMSPNNGISNHESPDFAIFGINAELTDVSFNPQRRQTCINIPLLPAALQPPRLHQKRSSNISNSNNLHENMSSTNLVSLQTLTDGKIQATRSQNVKSRNPERMSLDRRGLMSVPVITGESRLRLLSMQHNLLTKLDGISGAGLSRLVFLDVYGNQLERITGLESLNNLRVLLLGKNRIKRIEGLKTLHRLEVLDLHGNQLTQIGGLQSQGELKVLNLAGNQIKVLGSLDLTGLRSLRELNLRRNRLKCLLGFAETQQLTKLFLSNNEVNTIDDMPSLVHLNKLQELAIDNNPVSAVEECVSFLVSHLPQLQALNRIQVTDQMRRTAVIWKENRESLKCVAANSVQEPGKKGRENIIYNAKSNWEQMRSHHCAYPNLASSLKDLRSSTETEDGTKSDSALCKNSLEENQETVISDQRKKKMYFLYKNRTFVEKKLCRRPTIEKIEAVPVTRLPPILNQYLNQSPTSKRKSEFRHNDSSSLDMYPSDQSVQSKRSVSSLGNVDESNCDETSSSSSSSSIESSSEEKPPKEQINNVRPIKSANPRMSAPIISDKQENNFRPATSRPKPKSNTASLKDKNKEQGGDYLVEITGKFLNVYGQGSLRYIDKPWNQSKSNDVLTIKFNYVSFNSLVPVFSKIKNRFPNAENYFFRDTNIYCLGQLNALADLQGLVSLFIHEDGNPITRKEWHAYAIYRLSHWGLKFVNDNEVDETQVVKSSDTFKGLSNLVLYSLPETLLTPLLNKLQLDYSAEESACKWLKSSDPALRNVVCKEALQWRKNGNAQDECIWRHKGLIHFNSLINTTCLAMAKLILLEHEWPHVFKELIQNILVDYSQLEEYMKRKLNDLRPP
ncbi:Leucine-rich repeat,Leucine-rich repeat domain, L domain-like,Leucine-rich repeat, typical subtype [Cinara cedri]|uniref:Dynein axonemal assembly factor 1 homolog n=1 Tax=Cinara cedri TaxID=506608 RepID=A0A5E4MPU5_9HEMI|nr:Leucine-rich repeat,Leucine-rich repeat domain, L domain-like,Leucine-rich repeat, typical subtype [Cinara cedri]